MVALELIFCNILEENFIFSLNLNAVLFSKERIPK